MVVDRSLVSVITVSRNARATIRRTIDSVLMQSHPRIEYIVVDGASEDGTQEILRSYGDRLDYWFSEPDNGIADAFNKGIELSTGEIVGILNADDWYQPEAVEEVVSAFEEYPEADVVCGSVAFWDGTQRLWSEPSQPERLPIAMSVQHPATFVRRRRFEASGAFRTDFRCAMDYDLLLRFHFQEASFLAIPAELTSMQIGGLSNESWRLCCLETARAQRSAGIARTKVFIRLCKRLLDRPMRRALANLGFPGGLRQIKEPRSKP